VMPYTRSSVSEIHHPVSRHHLDNGGTVVRRPETHSDSSQMNQVGDDQDKRGPVKLQVNRSKISGLSMQ